MGFPLASALHASELLPFATMPISAALVLAPSVAFAFLPLPIVRMNGEIERGLKIVVVVSVPTIAAGVANDARRSAGRHQSRGPCAHDRNEGQVPIVFISESRFHR